MKKQRKKVSNVYKVFSSLLLLVSLLLLGLILYLNILGFVYLGLVVGAVVGLDIVCLVLMKKSKKFGYFLTGVIIVIFSFLGFNLGKTTNLLSKMNLNYKTYNYSVVVLKDSSYKKLKDINNKSLGYYDSDEDEGKKALDKVMKRVELENNGYPDVQALGTALLEGKEEAILVEDTYLDILDEELESDGGSFKSQIRKIYSFVIVVKTSDISRDINVTKKPFNIYVSGIDTYGEISSVSRSDVNMIVTVNPKTRQILLTSIPRDYYVALHGKSGYKDKLTHAGLYGVDMSIQTLEDLLDIEINYYVKVNFSSIIDIVNAIDGVNVYSDYSFTSRDNFNYQKGYNAVNGEQALSFARERYAFNAGDRQRVKNQQALLKAMFEKCTSKSIILKYSKLLDSVSGSFVTNMSMGRLTSLIKMQISKNYSWNIVSNSLDGKDSSNYTYSAPNSRAYVMEPIEESIEYGSSLIKQVFDGEKLDSDSVDADKDNINTVTKNNSSGSSNKKKDSSQSSSNTNSSASLENKEGFKARLGRSEVSFVEGDEYIYYGYTATYNGRDISNDSSIVEKFSVDGKVFDSYQDLVSYVSSLSYGSYSVIFTLTYSGKSVTLRQHVTVEHNDVIDSGTDNNNGEVDTGNSYDQYMEE